MELKRPTVPEMQEIPVENDNLLQIKEVHPTSIYLDVDCQVGVGVI